MAQAFDGLGRPLSSMLALATKGRFSIPRSPSISGGEPGAAPAPR